MVLIFDLDDTLYDESTYVQSGFRAVADFGRREFGWDADCSLRFMVTTLEAFGRGEIFDRWLKTYGKVNRALTKRCVQVYRSHSPKLELFRSADKLLRQVSPCALYLVTDGHKLVQARKIDALGIGSVFRRVFITHRYGIAHAKPSLYCFELIKESQRCEWRDMVYIGDNPAKDFVGLNRVGARTVRVLTGVHRNLEAAKGYDALHTISDLDLLLPLLEDVYS